MSKLTTLASRSNEQRKSRESLAEKHAKATESLVNNKTLQPIVEHLTVTKGSKKHGTEHKVAETKTVMKKRTSKVVQTLKAHSRAAHEVANEVRRSRR